MLRVYNRQHIQLEPSYGHDLHVSVIAVLGNLGKFPFGALNHILEEERVEVPGKYADVAATSLDLGFSIADVHDLPLRW